MGILGQDVNVCHLNKRFVENFFLNKNVFFRSPDQENWGLTKKVKMVLGKDAILANLWINFCDPLFKTGKNNAEIDSFFFPGNLSSTIE